MFELLIAVLVFVAVLAIGSAAIQVRAGRRRQVLEDRLHPTVYGVGGGAVALRGNWLTRALGRIGLAVSPGAPSRPLAEELGRAGFYGRSAPGVYMGTKALLLAVGLAGGAILLLPRDLTFGLKIFLIAVAGAALFFIPNEVVLMSRRRRQAEVRQHLPDVMDMLEICVSAGMGLDMAWNAVADEIRRVGPVIADEMALTNLEMHLGAPRLTAIRHMADRTGAEELVSLAGVLAQSERFGTSIADTLRVFASTMREERSMRAQEAAERVPVKLVFPLVVFIFPVVLVVCAGPTAVVLYRMLTEQ